MDIRNTGVKVIEYCSIIASDFVLTISCTCFFYKQRFFQLKRIELNLKRS